MVRYIIRWAEIYVTNPFSGRWCRVGLHDCWPGTARRQIGTPAELPVPDVEAAAARLAPRPWLMIHGERDDVHQLPRSPGGCSATARTPKELWLVPGCQAQSLPRGEPDGVRRADSSNSSSASRRAARCARRAGRSSLAHAELPERLRRRDRCRQSYQQRPSRRSIVGLSTPSRATVRSHDQTPDAASIGGPVGPAQRRLARAFLDQTSTPATSSATCC